MKRLVLLISLFSMAGAMAQSPRWSASAAADWYAHQPWLIGTNYLQSNTVNQIEMFQADTFDGDRIDMELGWAENLGINTIRVFLHEALWDHDSGNLKSKINKLLAIADKHKMKVIFVLFDSFGDPYPELGHQRQPKQGVRDSVWVQSPGAKGLVDRAAREKALAYAEDLVAFFNIDKRILAWDVWNEPELVNGGPYALSEPPNKLDLVRDFLPQVFQYVRAGTPAQPVTSGLYKGDWSSMATLSPIQKIQVTLSDFVSFQNYDGPQEFEKRVQQLKAFGRPVVCTGFLDRNQGSSVETILPIALKYDVGALVGDLVQGKAMRFLPWDSWQNPYVGREPSVWAQDLFLSTGPMYQPKDGDIIKQMIAQAPKPSTSKPQSKRK